MTWCKQHKYFNKLFYLECREQSDRTSYAVSRCDLGAKESVGVPCYIPMQAFPSLNGGRDNPSNNIATIIL